MIVESEDFEKWNKDTNTLIPIKEDPEKDKIFTGVKGWICPKCGKANAPWKGSCDCSAQYIPYCPYYPTPYYPPYTITWIAATNYA